MSPFESHHSPEARSESISIHLLAEIFEKSNIECQTVMKPATAFSEEEPVACVHVADGSTYEQTRSLVEAALVGQNLEITELPHTERDLNMAKEKGWKLPSVIILRQGESSLKLCINEVEIPADNEFNLSKGAYVTYFRSPR